MKWFPLLVGFLLPIGVAWSIVDKEWGHEMKAVQARGEAPELYPDEPFFPAADATSSDTLAAARFVLDRFIDELPGDEPEPAEGDAPAEEAAPEEAPAPLTEEALEAQFPGIASLDDGSVRILSLYVPKKKHAILPRIARLEGGVLQAVRGMWDQIPDEDKNEGLKARTRFKIDRVLKDLREFPLDGGYGGVGLDEGLDGILLRHEDEDDFYYLPSWSIERKVSRKKIHGRARLRARELGGWKKSRTKAAEFYAFRSRAFVEGDHGGGPAIPVARGNVDPGEITAELLADRIYEAGQYLARETNGKGKMTYTYMVESDSVDKGYNLLRHAGTTYSMLQAYRVRPEAELLEASKRAIGYYRRKMKEDSKNPGEWFVLDGKRAKLGGVGLGLCMMAEMEKVEPGFVDMDIVVGMAKHIERMQLPSGEFKSFYKWSDREVTRRKSIFYSGEAILGLLRVYQITGDEHWLDVAEKGADFLVNERWKKLGVRLYVPMDAWLLQALEELDRARPDKKRRWYAFQLSESIARRKIMDPATVSPDLLGGGVSGIKSLPHAATAGAFGEALSAAARLEARHKPGETRHRTYCMNNASFQLRNQFHTGNNWHVPNPARAMGSFRERVDDSTTRNDHVQHNLSGLFGLLDLLDPEAPDIGAVTFEGSGS